MFFVVWQNSGWVIQHLYLMHKTIVVYYEIGEGLEFLTIIHHLMLKLESTE